MAGFPLTRLLNRAQITQWLREHEAVKAFENAQRDILELFKRIFPDAPSDGTTYGRRNGAWTAVNGGAPVNAAYVLTEPSAALPAARLLQAGANVTITDSGPGQPVTIAAAAGGTTSPGAPLTSVQYNSAGEFAGDANVLMDVATATFRVGSTADWRIQPVAQTGAGGRNLTIASGNGSGVNAGCQLQLVTGTSGGISGDLRLESGAVASPNSSGPITIATGVNTGSGDTGVITMRTGAASAGSSGIWQAGSGTGSGTGTVTLRSGNGLNFGSGAASFGSGTSTTGQSGAVTVSSGNASGSFGSTGDVTIASGNASGAFGNSGNINITPGTATGTRGRVNITSLAAAGPFALDKTNTATVGNVTINNPSGRVNIAAGGTSMVLTNNLITTASTLILTLATNDATAKSACAVAAAGSATLTLNAASTGAVAINFLVVN